MGKLFFVGVLILSVVFFMGCNYIAISFDENGGDEGVMQPFSAEPGVLVELPLSEYMKMGAVFTEWNTNSDGSGIAYPDGVSLDFPAVDLLLYAQWQDQVAIPSISPCGGVFAVSQQVTVSCSTVGATIYYTTDGSNPDLDSAIAVLPSTPVSFPVEVGGAVFSVKAIAVKGDYAASEIATAVFNVPSVFVEGGAFSMGASTGRGNEDSISDVTVDSFYMSRYEVTQKQWVDVMGVDSNPSEASPAIGWESLPVGKVTWYKAVEFCNALSLRGGLELCYSEKSPITCDFDRNGYRLPTEAEWEYAARGGKVETENFLYSGSDILKDVAWCGRNSRTRVHPVGEKIPNALGLYDMSGNVREWCWDKLGIYRVVRNGSWYSNDKSCLVTSRSDDYPGGFGNYANGFRVVRSSR